MKYFFLVFYVLTAWVVHAALVSLYLPLFATTISFWFRLTHVAEIFLVMAIALGLYVRRHLRIQKKELIAVSWGTLAVIDVVFFKVIPPSFTSLDMWHVAAAFTAVGLSGVIASLYARRS